MGKTEIEGEKEPNHGKQKQHHNGIVGHPVQQLFPFHNESADTDKKTTGTETVQSGDVNNSTIYYMLALIAIIVAGGVILIERKKKISK